MTNGCSILNINIEQPILDVSIFYSILKCKCINTIKSVLNINIDKCYVNTCVKYIKSKLNCKVEDRCKLRVEVICEVGEKPYLTISPDILWVLPDLSTDNYVNSNTHWNVN